jgi:hypothetical protein
LRVKNSAGGDLKVFSPTEILVGWLIRYAQVFRLTEAPWLGGGVRTFSDITAVAAWCAPYILNSKDGSPASALGRVWCDAPPGAWFLAGHISLLNKAKCMLVSTLVGCVLSVV